MVSGASAMKYKIVLAAAGFAVLWHYTPQQFWPLFEVYAAAECLLLIVSLLTK